MQTDKKETQKENSYYNLLSTYIDEGKITDSNVKNYLNVRVKEMMAYYYKNAELEKRCFIIMRSITVILGAIVPIIVNINSPFSIAITTALSTAVVIIIALESVYQFRGRWKNHRAAEQMIMRETTFFLTRTGPYEKLFENEKDEPNREAFHSFVKRIEGIIANESSATLHTMTSSDSSDKEPTTSPESSDNVSEGGFQKKL